MTDKHARRHSDSQSVDPTRGGSGRAEGSLAGDPGNDPPRMSDIQEYLEDIVYPIGKQDIVAHARRQHAPLAVLDRLEFLPDRTYKNPAELSEALDTRETR